jgi:hypothetical protein
MLGVAESLKTFGLIYAVIGSLRPPQSLRKRSENILVSQLTGF